MWRLCTAWLHRLPAEPEPEEPTEEAEPEPEEEPGRVIVRLGAACLERGVEDEALCSKCGENVKVGTLKRKDVNGALLSICAKCYTAPVPPPPASPFPVGVWTDFYESNCDAKMATTRDLACA